MSLLMERIYFVLLYFSLITFYSGSAKKFTVCELARTLVDHGVNRTLLPNWVCLIQNESGMRTDVVGGPNPNGSFDYGLFQINSKWWCGQEGKRAGGCNVPCEDLLDDDITVSKCCAWHIYNLRGFEAWNGWKKRCKGKTLPNLDKCFTTNEILDENQPEDQFCSKEFVQEYLNNRTQTQENETATTVPQRK